MTIKRAGVELTSTSITNIGQAGAAGGHYYARIVPLSGYTPTTTVTLGISGANNTLPDADKLLDVFDDWVGQQPVFVGPFAMAASEYLNAQASAANEFTVQLMGEDD